MRSGEIYLLMFILVLTGVAVWVDFAPGDKFLERDVHTRLGLDLQGGIQVLLRADQQPGAAANTKISAEEMKVTAGVLERRVNALGVGETVVQRTGTDRIIVELPGVANPDQAIETLRGTGRLEFVDPQGQPLAEGQRVRTAGSPNPVIFEPKKPITSTTGLSGTNSLSETTVTTTTLTGPIYPNITDGKDLDTASVQPTFSSGSAGLSEPAVAFAFKNESAVKLAAFTANNVGKQMCIVLDNVVISCPVIQAALTGGSGVITSRATSDRDRIYSQLKFGALPIALHVETSRTVSATLGRDSVKASLIAGAVGLIVVGLFMLLFYRLPGFLAVIALLIYTALSFAFYRLIPITLTLAGIAGFILSIGLAVDANVLIFARLKEELRRKKSLPAAIEAGFDEAWPAIRDSSVSTLITSVILYLFGNSFGVSIIKGFAITLGLGILTSLFTAIIITRTFLRLIVPLGFADNLWFFDIEQRDFQAPEIAEAEAL